MQTQSQVRFYITQGDDQTVVRTIPVPQRVVEPKPAIEQSVAAAAPARAHQSPVKSVAGRVRSAVKRAGNPA